MGQYAIQYAKAMQYKVAALDINDSVLQQAKDFGADITFNTLTSSTYVEDLKKATTGGVHAAAIFSGAKAAYANGPKILRVNGILMVVGVLAEPLQVNVMDLIIGNYRVKAESTSTPQRMQRAVEFTARHKIEPKVSFHKLEDINTMIHLMETGSSTGRMVVIF